MPKWPTRPPRSLHPTGDLGDGRHAGVRRGRAAASACGRAIAWSSGRPPTACSPTAGARPAPLPGGRGQAPVAPRGGHRPFRATGRVHASGPATMRRHARAHERALKARRQQQDSTQRGDTDACQNIAGRQRCALVACQSMTAAALRRQLRPRRRTPPPPAWQRGRTAEQAKLHAGAGARQHDGHRGRRHPARELSKLPPGLQGRGLGHRRASAARDGARRQRQDLHRHARRSAASTRSPTTARKRTSRVVVDKLTQPAGVALQQRLAATCSRSTRCCATTASRATRTCSRWT